jgi:hypothetical protein
VLHYSAHFSLENIIIRYNCIAYEIHILTFFSLFINKTRLKQNFLNIFQATVILFYILDKKNILPNVSFSEYLDQ